MDNHYACMLINTLYIIIEAAAKHISKPSRGPYSLGTELAPHVGNKFEHVLILRDALDDLYNFVSIH